MAKYHIRTELQAAGNNYYQDLKNELKKYSGKEFKIILEKAQSLPETSEAYEIEGNITIQELGSILSKVSARINKDYSFTIVKSKAGVYV